MTGDLLSLSGSSVTLKRKTNVHIRNTSANHSMQQTTSCINAPISSKATSVSPNHNTGHHNINANFKITDGSSPTYTYYTEWTRKQDIGITNKTEQNGKEKVKQKDGV